MLARVKSPRAKRILEGMTDKRRKRDLQTCIINGGFLVLGLCIQNREEKDMFVCVNVVVEV